MGIMFYTSATWQQCESLFFITNLSSLLCVTSELTQSQQFNLSADHYHWLWPPERCYCRRRLQFFGNPFNKDECVHGTIMTLITCLLIILFTKRHQTTSFWNFAYTVSLSFCWTVTQSFAVRQGNCFFLCPMWVTIKMLHDFLLKRFRSAFWTVLCYPKVECTDVHQS